jgi:hypothetical protein
MTYEVSFHQKPTYLHAVVTGRNSKENVIRYLEDVLRECSSHGYHRVLIEERLEGPRLGTLDIYTIVSRAAGQASGLLRAVAYVDVNSEGSLMRFAETVALNRALPVAVFSSVADAEGWLLAADPRIP